MSLADDDVFPLLQSAVAGRFSIERELGRGGMGIVFLAHDVLLERPVAIKLLAPALAASPVMRARFVSEARLAAQCFHPHIVPIHEVGESGNLAWFVMAYVPGETLSRHIQRAGPLEPDRVQQIAREIGWALAYAHERGVVHRDIKPENILLEEGTGRALLSDFGIAFDLREQEQPGSRSAVAGTARYMAPEQALGQALDGRADLYALAVTLYVAASGRYPEPATRCNLPGLPPALAAAVDRCLAASAADRLPDARSFVRLIEPKPAAEPMPAPLQDLQNSYRSVGSMIWWTAALAAAGIALIASETPGSLGAAFNWIIARLFVSLALGATALKSVDLLRAARAAVRLGASTGQLEDALLGNNTPHLEWPSAGGQTRNRRHADGLPKPLKKFQALSAIVAGSALAASIGSFVHWLPYLSDPILSSLQIVALFSSPILMRYGFTTLWHGSPGGRSLSKSLAQKTAHALGRLFKARKQASRRTLWRGSGTTEMRLGQMAEDILARLPASVREQLPDLARAAKQLRERASQLRQRESELAALSGVDRQHELIRTELSSTIAALETLRLDLLRLESSVTLPGMTDPLLALDDLRRHVEAVDELEPFLHQHRAPEGTQGPATTPVTIAAPTPTPTPTATPA